MAYVTPVKLEEPTRNRLKALGEARERTIGWMVKRAINEYLDREERKEQFKQEALSTWRNYQLTGLHVTAEEGREWLLALEAGEERAQPVCHL